MPIPHENYHPAYWHSKYEVLAEDVARLYRSTFSHSRLTKGKPMADPLSQIAAIKTQVDVLKAAQGTTAPTTNFVTPDVQSALDDLATDAGVPATTPTPTS